MAVRHNQIEEIFDVVGRRITREQLRAIISDLSNVEAYKTNASYRETIRRVAAHALVEMHKPK
jgi:hypothetical protein